MAALFQEVLRGALRLNSAVHLQKCAGFGFDQEADQLSKLLTFSKAPYSHSINEENNPAHPGTARRIK